jgi:hypothetical protein
VATLERLASLLGKLVETSPADALDDVVVAGLEAAAGEDAEGDLDAADLMLADWAAADDWAAATAAADTAAPDPAEPLLFVVPVPELDVPVVPELPRPAHPGPLSTMVHLCTAL